MGREHRQGDTDAGQGSYLTLLAPRGQGSYSTRLAPRVVGVEEIAMSPILLADGIAHHLNVLAVFVRQSCQVVSALFQCPDAWRAAALHECLRRGAHIFFVRIGVVHHRQTRRHHAGRGIALDEIALRVREEAGEYEHCRAQRHRRHLDPLHTTEEGN
eukprot:scaffold12565_cov35-Tisochrysis_lutea.AAC.2